MLISRVEFSLSSTNRDIGKRTVENIEDINHIIQPDYLWYPAILKLERFVCINGGLGDQHHTQRIKTDSLEFFVVDKLVYLKDVFEILNKRDYTIRVDFHPGGYLKQDTPCLFYKANIDCSKDKPMAPGTDKIKELYVCKPFNEIDIVTNTNLKQILPINTGKPPRALVDLLAQKNEKIY